MDKLQDGFLGLFIVTGIRSKEELPTARTFADVYSLVDSFPRLFDFIGKSPVTFSRPEIFVPVDGVDSFLILFLEQLL